MLRQCVVGGDAPIGRVDHRDPDLPMVSETNSLTFHSLPSDQEADQARYDALVGAGFSVAVIWETALWSHPSNVVAAIRETRRRSRCGEPAIVHSAGCPWPEDPARIVIPVGQPPTRG